MRGKLVVLLCLVLIGAGALWVGCSDDTPVATAPPRESMGPPPTDTVAGLLLGPIAGVTTAWHAVPIAFAVPDDVERLTFKCAAGPAARVVWRGARETSRDATASYAEAAAPEPGVHTRVQVTVTEGPGAEEAAEPKNDAIATFECAFTVSDVTAKDVRIDRASVTADVVVTESMRPAERLQLLLANRSIAPVTIVGADRYRTGVGTVVRVEATASRDEFAPLVEWRINGTAQLLGASGSVTLPLEPGTWTLSAGPLVNERVVQVDVFETIITVEGSRIVPGRPTTFRATTNPPGFERDMVWMSATLWGEATPAIGRGATFRATFEQPWPTTNDGILCMGVRAGNASFVVEQELASFEADMTRLHDDLDDVIDGFGEKVCCLSDSLAQAQLFEATNKLVVAKNGVANALAAYSSLPGWVKGAVNVLYTDVAAELQAELTELEAAIADLNALPDCGAPAAALNTVRLVTLCQVLCIIGKVLIVIGALLVTIGGLIFQYGPTAEAKAIGAAMAIVGGILLLVGAILVGIANIAMGCPC